MTFSGVQQATSLIDRSNPTGATDGTRSVQRTPLGVGGSPDQLLQTEPGETPASNKGCCTTLCDLIAEVFESCRKFLAQIPCIGCCFLTPLEGEIRAYLEDARSRTEVCKVRFLALHLTLSRSDFNQMSQQAMYGLSRREIPPALLSIIGQQRGQEYPRAAENTMHALINVLLFDLEPHEEVWTATIKLMIAEELLVLGQCHGTGGRDAIAAYQAANEAFYADGRDARGWSV